MHINNFYPKLKYNLDIKGITSNSKEVKKDFIFVAIKGIKNDGRKYIKEAISNGASLIVTNKPFISKTIKVIVTNPKIEYIRLLQIFYSYTNNIYTVGVTGTDGKTTTSSLLNSIFNQINKSALIGTNGLNYLNRKIKTNNTTPKPSIIYQAYQVFNKHNIKDLVMEVSSEAILDKRIYNYHFHGAIMTNLTHEHLNTHKTMDSYFKCKMKLFESLDKSGLAVINADCPYSLKIPYYTKAKVITYGINQGDYKAYNLVITSTYSEFDVFYKNKFLYHFKINLFGKYNIYNALAAIAYSYELGIPLEIIEQGLIDIKQIKGRNIRYEINGVLVIIDYAHTPNSIANLLENVKLFTKGKLLLVIGAQGEKDKSKRSIMGNIATNLADTVIFTSEDPKDESVFSIISDLTYNLNNSDYYITYFREDAIKLAISLANKGDTVIIVGKGDEDTEIINGIAFKHNDLDVVKKYLK
jgi:UDP-N-acetylmuramoyl-L-alanyl-D-glutamate--2,6-diaminopimelate ligase